MKMINRAITVLFLILFIVCTSISVLADGSCDINKIISENKRVSELEGQKTRQHIDDNQKQMFIDIEAQGWDWLNAVKIYVKEQIKGMVMLFALSLFGAILFINGVVGIILLRIQRNKFVALIEEVNRINDKFDLLFPKTKKPKEKIDVNKKLKEDEVYILSKKVSELIKIMKSDNTRPEGTLNGSKSDSSSFVESTHVQPIEKKESDKLPVKKGLLDKLFMIDREKIEQRKKTIEDNKFKG